MSDLTYVLYRDIGLYHVCDSSEIMQPSQVLFIEPDVAKMVELVSNTYYEMQTVLDEYWHIHRGSV